MGDQLSEDVGKQPEAEIEAQKSGELEDLSKKPAEELVVKNTCREWADEVEKAVTENPDMKGPLSTFVIMALRIGGDIASLMEKYMPFKFEEGLEKEPLKEISLNKEEKETVSKGEIIDKDLTKELEGLHFEKASTKVACRILGIKEVSDPRVLAASLKHAKETKKEKDFHYYKTANVQQLKANGLVEGMVLMGLKIGSFDFKELPNEIGYMTFVAIDKDHYCGFDPESGEVKTFDINDKKSPINFKDLSTFTLAFVPTFVTGETAYFKDKADQMEPEIDKSPIGASLKITDDLILPVFSSLETFERELSNSSPYAGSIARIYEKFETLEKLEELDRFFEANATKKEYFVSRYKGYKEKMDNLKVILEKLSAYLAVYSLSVDGKNPENGRKADKAKTLIGIFDKIYKFLYTTA